MQLVIENWRNHQQWQIAQTYALALRSSYPTDWVKVNRLIVDRWPRGLERIKKMAWSGKCFEHQPTQAWTKERANDGH